MVVRTQNVIGTIERKADLKGLDLDAVRVVEDDPDEPTFRVLAVDAPDERDQVGFQITHPSGPLSQEMFSERLEQYLQALKDEIRGNNDDTESDETDDEYDLPDPEELDEDNDPDENDENGAEQKAADQAHADQGSNRTLGDALDTQHVTVELEVTGDEFTDEIEETFADLVEPLGEDLDDVEADVEDIDERLSRIEETLGQVGTDQ